MTMGFAGLVLFFVAFYLFTKHFTGPRTRTEGSNSYGCEWKIHEKGKNKGKVSISYNPRQGEYYKYDVGRTFTPSELDKFMAQNGIGTIELVTPKMLNGGKEPVIEC